MACLSLQHMPNRTEEMQDSIGVATAGLKLIARDAHAGQDAAAALPLFAWPHVHVPECGAELGGLTEFRTCSANELACMQPAGMVLCVEATRWLMGQNHNSTSPTLQAEHPICA
jgi:hypothetical protein